MRDPTVLIAHAMRLYGPLPFVKTACVGYRDVTARLYSAH